LRKISLMHTLISSSSSCFFGFHQVKFRAVEFIRSCIWEYFGILWNLPLIWLLGGNKWILTNRWYMPNKDNAVAFYVMALPFQLLLGAGHIVYILDVQGVRQRVDVAQILLLHAMVFTRGAVVAIKYAYMSARDLADNYSPAWDGVSKP